MAGGGGNSAVTMRLNIMTALYLPILLYSMSTFDLDSDSLVLDSNNHTPHVVADNQSVAVGEAYEASIMFTLKGGGTANKENSDALFVPEIELDYSKTPNALTWDPEAQELVMDTDQLFAQEAPDIFTKEVSFAGTIKGKTAKDIKQDKLPSYTESISGTFTVFKPTIQVQSNAVPKLYANSRNELSFTVPGVPTTELSLKEKFSDIETQQNNIQISPSGDTAAIAVYRANSTNPLGEKGFKVVKPPIPQIGLRVPNQNSFLSPSEAISINNEYELVIKADRVFFDEYSDDAQYDLEEIQISVSRTGLVPLRRVIGKDILNQIKDSGKESVGEYVYTLPFSQVFPNENLNSVTSLTIYITELSRINYQNRKLPIDKESVANSLTFRVN